VSIVERAIQRFRIAGGAREVGDRHATVPPKPDTPPNAPEAPGAPARCIDIDLDAMRLAALVPEESVKRRFAAHFRQIKRPLLSRSATPATATIMWPRVIVTTSALPGDGKSFTTFNLAMSMASERDMSVLLVDGDVASPHISRSIGVAAEPGLMEALQNEAVDAESLVLSTNVRGLALLPAGRPDQNATELLASRRMAEIVQRLLAADARRIILIDSPPLLVSTEARALVAVAGQVVLVVRADVTPRQAMLDALALIGNDKCAGLVLNDSSAPTAAGTYGYGDDD
jgi:protein-tyrosine kinase